MTENDQNADNILSYFEGSDEDFHFDENGFIVDRSVLDFDFCFCTILTEFSL